MYLRRDLNVRKNTYQYPDQEFGMVPHSKPSVSFKQSRKPIVDDVTANEVRAPDAGQSDLFADSTARRTGTLTTLPHSQQIEDGTELFGD